MTRQFQISKYAQQNSLRITYNSECFFTVPSCTSKKMKRLYSTANAAFSRAKHLCLGSCILYIILVKMPQYAMCKCLHKSSSHSRLQTNMYRMYYYSYSLFGKSSKLLDQPSTVFHCCYTIKLYNEWYRQKR